MGEQVKVRWSQPTINGTPVGPRWYAVLEKPFVSVEFAGLFGDGGGWRLELWTSRRRIDGGLYPTLATPQKHVDRWAQHHWRTLAPRGGIDPRGAPKRGGAEAERQYWIRVLADVQRGGPRR